MSGARTEAVTALVFDARPAQQGAQQFQAAGQQIIQSNAQVTQATTRTADSQTSLTRAMERMTRQLDPAAAAQAKLAREQEMLDRAYQRGIVSADRYSRNLQLLQERADRQAAAAARGAAANDNMRGAMQQAERAAQGFAQQLGPLGTALTALGPAGLAVAAGLGAITLGLGAAVRAATEFETLGLRTQAIIQATGGAAGLTAQQIRDMSQAIARDTLASTAGVEAAAAQLLTFRSVAGTTFERTLRAAQDLAATGFGSIESAAVQLGKALEDPAQGLSALSRSGVTFSTAQRDVIQQLVATGQAAEAQRLILEAVERQVGGAGAAQAGGLAGAYDTLGQNVQEFLVRVGNLGPIQLATGAINALAGAIGMLDGALARISRTEPAVVVAQRAVTTAETAVSSLRGQLAGVDQSQMDQLLARGLTRPQALSLLAPSAPGTPVRDLDAAMQAALDRHAQAQIALIAAEEESQRAQTAAAIRGIAERAAAEKDAAASALAAMRATMDQRIGIQQTYETRVATIQRAARSGLLSQAQAEREVAAATQERTRALARLDAPQGRATAGTQRQTDAERDLAREIERGVALVQQTQTEGEKYTQQLRQLDAALAAARITQEQFNRAVTELDPAQKAARDAAQRATRAAEQAAKRQEQEATRTTERITDFFASSFARAFESTGGGFKSLMDSFRRAAISTFASIAAQAIIRPIIAPIVASFGGSGFGSMLGMGGGGTGASVAGSGGFGLDQILSGVGLGRSIGIGNLFGGGTGGSMFGGIGDSISGFLSRPLYTPPFAVAPSFNSPDFIGAAAPMNTIGSTLGAAAGIAGGAFGIYSGIQKGGIGGAFMGAGGAAGMAAGLATLTGIGAALLPILGPLAIALPLIGMLLPGQRPSSKMQGVIGSFADDNLRQIGFDGAKFSSENRGIADQFAESLRGQERALSDMVGFRAAGGFDLRVGDERGDGPAIEFRMGGRNAAETQRFGKDEAGLRALSEYANAQLFLSFQEAAENLDTDAARIVRGSTSMEALTGNLEFFNGAYKSLQDITALTDTWTGALRDLNAPFDAAITKARELGLSTQGLADAQAAVVADAERRRQLQISGIMAGLGVREAGLRGDVLGAALLSFDAQAAQQMQQMRDALRDVGITGETAAQTLLRTERILAEERLAIQREYADRQNAATRQSLQGVIDWLNNQRLGATSSLSPFAQMQEAERQFRAAQEANDLAGLTRAGDALLTSSRSVLGGATEAYNQREMFVRATVAQTGQRAAAAAGDQPAVAALQAEINRLNDTVIALRQSMQQMADNMQRTADRAVIAA